jgi:hypothetical protein
MASQLPLKLRTELLVVVVVVATVAMVVVVVSVCPILVFFCGFDLLRLDLEALRRKL